VNGECVPFVNGYVQGFNAALKSLLQQLTSTLPGATFVYANAYDMVQSFINNPANYGTCDQHILHSIESWKMVTKQTSVHVTANHQKHNILLLLAVQISCRSSNV
jgi:phospholipase/lecithinase/hemolysin